MEQTADFAENADDTDGIREICAIRGWLLQARKLLLKGDFKWCFLRLVTISRR